MCQVSLFGPLRIVCALVSAALVYQQYSSLAFLLLGLIALRAAGAENRDVRAGLLSLFVQAVVRHLASLDHSSLRLVSRVTYLRTNKYLKYTIAAI